jgi:hypothetical protein
VVYVAFYEQGFGLPSHRFLHSLLWSYGLELHHLTRSGILHMADFVTLCEAYIGIEPPLKLWSHFFHARLWHDSSVGAACLGSVDISVHFGPGADSYFSIPQPDPPIVWWKAWFLLKDGADAPHPTFMGGCPIPIPAGSMGWPRLISPGCGPYLRFWGVTSKSLIGEEMIQTFLDCLVQPLRQQEAAMGKYSGPGCLVCPYFLDPVARRPMPGRKKL